MDIEKILLLIGICAPGFLLAIVGHEFAHAYVAKKFGDTTAEDAGRLTLNPAVHIDMMGTIIFPLILLSFGSGMFGWAKPVPVNTRNFKDLKRGIFWVSFAGPLANFSLAILSLIALLFVQLVIGRSGDIAIQMLNYSLIINIVLGIFNLVPIPPTDGSKMLSCYLPYNLQRHYRVVEENSQIIWIGIIGLSFLGFPILSYFINPIIRFADLIRVYFLHLLG
jgi:Zn-dependent protease